MVVLRHVVLLFALCLLICSLTVAPGTNKESSEDTLTNEQPIVVVGNSNFSSAYWHGEGSASSPYVLENMAIATNITCVSISNTSSYFIIKDCSFLSFWYENYAIGYAAIRLNNVTNGVIQNCGIDGSAGGIRLLHCSNMNVTGNILGSEHSDGLWVFDSANIYLYDNYMDRTGIVGWQSLSLNISGNMVYDSRQAGIHLDNVPHSYLAENLIIHSDDHGLFIVSSPFSTVTHNIISDSGAYGISAFTSNCSFIGNTIRNSHSFGVEVVGSGNVVSGNLFSNNTLSNANDRGRDNTWEGNYWDDYIGLGSYSVDGTAGSEDPHPQGYPGILTPVQIALFILVPTAILAILYLAKRRRE